MVCSRGAAGLCSEVESSGRARPRHPWSTPIRFGDKRLAPALRPDHCSVSAPTETLSRSQHHDADFDNEGRAHKTVQVIERIHVDRLARFNTPRRNEQSPVVADTLLPCSPLPSQSGAGLLTRSPFRHCAECRRAAGSSMVSCGGRAGTLIVCSPYQPFTLTGSKRPLSSTGNRMA